ncbi:MAG: sugar phosphate isomerase/epimerase [Chloroflexi bacterium]|nr:sugar phosphate isomerase/epimerase [Chloroflexota bacterium]
MKLGVFDPIYGRLDLGPMLDRIAAIGLEAVELGTGNYPGDRHCRPAELLADDAACRRLADAVASRGLIVSALSCHGNPLHPDRERAARDDAVFRDTVRLAERLGVGVVNVFSGCPGDGPGARRPNWVTTAWPTEFSDILAWQWDEVVLPYWREAGRFAADHGVSLAFEMHPGFVVYNPRTLLRLRSEVGEVVGANMDPSHLFWQGIDPVLAIRELAGTIFHVDAKDTAIDPHNVARNGVLDMPPSRAPIDRPWFFRSVGDGNDLLFWKRFVSALRLAGYDHVISIEHEDPLASTDEGIARAVATLRAAILSEPADASW